MGRFYLDLLSIQLTVDLQGIAGKALQEIEGSETPLLEGSIQGDDVKS
jgi:hypothetical protein